MPIYTSFDELLKGKFLLGTATTSATAGATADVIFTVPGGKIWSFAVVSVSVNATNNNVFIFADGNKIWEDLANITIEQVIDLTTRYPRPIDVTSNIVIRVQTNEAVAKTLTAKVWVLERS